MSNQKIERLPKWAQEYILDIEREREAARKKLNKYLDKQTPSCFYTEDLVSTGEQHGPSRKIRYLPDVHTMYVEHADVKLEVSIYGVDGIRIQWSDAQENTNDKVAMIPKFHNYVEIKHRAHTGDL